MDLLAHARALDPDTVAAHEREFDFQAAAQPLGSAAATAGESSSGRFPPIKETGDIYGMSVDGYDSDDSECIDSD